LIITPLGKQIAILKCAETWEVAREILINNLMELMVKKMKIPNYGYFWKFYL